MSPLHNSTTTQSDTLKGALIEKELQTALC